MTAPARLDNVADVYPLTPMQQGMLYHSIAEPASGVFVNQVVTRLSGTLDVAAFRSAWDDLAERHAVLRTAFVWDGLDAPLQVVRQRVEFPWSEHDWADAPPDEQQARLDTLLRRDRAAGFDLAAAPLMRLALIRTGGTSWRWVWSLHHLIADGWSVQVLVDELVARYAELVGGPPAGLGPTPPYRDFIARQLDRGEGDDEAYWRRRLAGFRSPHVLDVPGLPPEPGTAGLAQHSFDLGPAASDALRAFGRNAGVTLNTLVFGAWAVLLARWTRSRDVVFGVTLAGRDAELPGYERAVGLFINTLPARVDVDPDQPLGRWLRAVQAEQLELREVEWSSLPAVQRWSEIPAGEALFESLFVFENYPPAPERQAGELKLGDMQFIEQSNYPLAVLVVPGQRLGITFVYDAARFAPDAVASLADQLTTLLEQLPERSGEPLSRLQLVAPGEAEVLATLGAGPALPSDERTVHELISAAAEARPSAPAVATAERTLTYAELDRAASALAARLVAAGVTVSEPVGLYLPRSVEMVVGLLGILRAGAAYVPLDPGYPENHVRSLIADEAISVVVTDRARRSELPGTVVLVDDGGTPPQAEPPAAGPDDLAYVIHTSGSTGRPKGVMVTHRSLVASTRARAVHYGASPGSFLLLSSFAFDSSVVGIFWTLCTGGMLVLPAPNFEHDVDGLLGLAAAREVTHLLCLPALYEVLLEEHAGRLGSLQVAIVAGEAAPPNLLERHRRHLPGAELHNEYGPTEATVWCTAHRATDMDVGRPLPIGRPIAGTRIHLLDDVGNRVPRGFAGELCVAGANLTRGYLHRPDLTADRFVTVELEGGAERVYRTGDLACYERTGTIGFLGRADRQLKIRGHRIETSAVEATLRSHPAVRDAAVAGRRVAGRSTDQLVAWVHGENGEPNAPALQGALAASLPDFMVPSVIVAVPSLPRLPNGKVDYGALPEPGVAAADAFVEPRTDAEKTIATIWADLMAVASVGARDDFFALGGDSIVGIQMASRARQAGLHISPGDIAAYPTVAELAAVALQRSATPADRPVTGEVPLGPMQRWFLEADFASPNHWNMSAVFDLPGDADPAHVRVALQAVLDNHDMLRARFHRDERGWRQTIAPPHPVTLEVVQDRQPGPRFAAAQAGLDLARGPLVRAVLATGGDRCRLLVAAHHLVVDAVSWLVIGDDLDLAYRQAAAGSAVELPPRTASYREWVERLLAVDRAAEVPHWAGRGDAGSPRRDLPGTDPGTEAERRIVDVELDGAATRAMLTTANDPYRTVPEELLVAALVETTARWVGGDAASIEIEGHGRPDDLDLSRTVGWFTSSYPLTFDVPDTGDDGDLIKSVKERLRAVPAGGAGYGVLRYVEGQPDLVDTPTPSFLFNYLGGAAPGSGRVVTQVGRAADTARSPDNARTHLVEVVAAVRDGRLAVEWHYGAAAYHQATIQGVAAAHLAVLRRLVEHRHEAGSGGFTPSDFPEAGLDQDELDAFLDSLG